MAGGQNFYWTSLIPGVSEAPHHVTMAIFGGALLIGATAVARAQLGAALRSTGGAIVPDEKLTYRNFFEIVAEKIYNLCESTMGHHNAKAYFPIIGTIFLYILTLNVLGMIPGVPPSTDNLNTTLGIGFFVFLYYNYQGIKENGLSYLKHFFGPVWWLAPLMLLIELVSHIVRPISLAFRLRLNIFADHLVFHTFSDLVPLAIPIVFYALGFFVCFVQAFVFSLMTMVYISMATAHDH
jgi:F-type H+-transporting ATPase subunit a